MEWPNLIYGGGKKIRTKADCGRLTRMGHGRSSTMMVYSKSNRGCAGLCIGETKHSSERDLELEWGQESGIHNKDKREKEGERLI